MARVPITDLQIHVWTPLSEGKPCIARIGSLPMIFHGETPMKARNAADTWRTEEVGKIEAREAAKEKRLKAAAEARASRKNPAPTTHGESAGHADNSISETGASGAA